MRKSSDHTGAAGERRKMELTTGEILSRFAFFSELPESERVRGRDTARLAKLPDRKLFYHQGQWLDQFGLVGAGSIRVYRISESGREITLYHVRAGEICLVNLLSVLLNREACATAEAEGPVTAVLLPGNPIRTWIRSSDTFRSFVFENMGQRLLDVMTLAEEIAFRKMDQRLAEYLQRQAAAGSQIITTHEVIASELGTAREVVSRLLAAFAQQGAIALGRGRIEVKRLDRILGAQSGLAVTKSQTTTRRPR
jgi:CRP/FNR family transcriptional regulator, anaerobic regulatory protein